MKDPAVLLYTKDFLEGVSDLTMDERGQYITLLCMQHQKGELTDKSIRLALGNPSPDVLAKFDKLENGNYRNGRMHREAEKRLAFCESRQNNGKMGGRPKASGKPVAKASGKPTRKRMGNLAANANAIVDSIAISNANGNATHLHKPMLDAYLSFMADREVPPMVELADHAALKKIRAYLLTATTEDKVLDTWQHFLTTWDKWPEWNQSKLRLRDIHSGMQNLIAHLRKSKKKTLEEGYHEIWGN